MHLPCRYRSVRRRGDSARIRRRGPRQRRRQVNRVVAELLANGIDGSTAAVAPVERRELQLCLFERELRERDSEKANRQRSRPRPTIELQDDAVNLDVDAGG